MKRSTVCISMIISLFTFLSHIFASSQVNPTGNTLIADTLKFITEKRIDDKPAAGLNEWIIVYVAQLDKLLQSTNGKSPVLYINGMPLVDCRALIVDKTRKELHFFLMRTDSTKAIWNWILGKPKALTKFVKLSVGPKDGPPIPSESTNFTLIVIRGWQFWVFLPLLVVFLLAVYLLYKKTSLLRDSPTEHVPEAVKRTYSLARSQILFWSVIVLTSFVFIWSSTGDINTITDSVLVLIGISSATALGARAIDSTNASQNSANPPDEAKKAAAVRYETTTGSFWKDLIGGNSDDGIHRLQIVIWTVVLGIIFICSVWSELTMPDFNGTLLTLMGISSGTYIGFKMKE